MERLSARSSDGAALLTSRPLLPGGCWADIGAAELPSSCARDAARACTTCRAASTSTTFWAAARSCSAMRILGDRRRRGQLRKGTTYFQLSEPTLALAEDICRAVPCAEQIRFISTGTEATFFALRLARAFRKRDKILKFEGGFHGTHDYSLMSVPPPAPKAFPAPTPDSAGIPHAIQEQVLVAPFNDLAETEAIIAAHHDDLAAVIAEPFQRLIAPAPGFLQGVREITRRYGVPLIFDEIVTGFRFAYGGAQEYYGVMPDLAALGKIIGGGFRSPRWSARARSCGTSRLARGDPGVRHPGRHAERQPDRRRGRAGHARRAAPSRGLRAPVRDGRAGEGVARRRRGAPPGSPRRSRARPRCSRSTSPIGRSRPSRHPHRRRRPSTPPSRARCSSGAWSRRRRSSTSRSPTARTRSGGPSRSSATRSAATAALRPPPTAAPPRQEDAR